MTMVADVVADGLARAGATRVFAVASQGETQALIAACERRGLRVIRVERSDVACVLAGVSGALGGVPGAALIGRDLVGASAGLAYASSDRLPVVVISSDVPVTAGGTKAALAVTPESAAHWIAHGCQLAMKEPWGPVRLDVPPAVATAAALPVATSCRPAPRAAPDAGTLDAAVRLLEGAERPVVVVGLLCRSEADAMWVRAFAEARPAPVLATPKGRGVLPDPHPLLIGTLDGGEAERALIASADLVVAIGVDPAELREGAWPSSTPVLHFTPLIGDSPPSDVVSVAGEIGAILEELAPRLRDRRAAEWDVARLHALKQAAAAPPVDPRHLTAYRLAETARRLTPAGTVAVFEGGDVWPVAAGAWRAVAPGECLIATGPPTRGFAVAAATAAQLARPDHRVVCFTDAESLHGAGDQLATLAALGVPALIVVADAAPALAAPPGLRTRAAPSIAGFAAIFEAALAEPAPAVLAVAAPSK